MNVMKKKSISAIMAVMMMTSLTACGGAEESTNDSAADTATTTIESGTVAAEAQVESGAEEEINYFGFESPVTLKVGLSYASDFGWAEGESPTDNVWIDLYAENNIMIDVLYEVDPSQSDTKLSTAIMSGDYPDLLTASKADYQTYAATGVIADITEAYEKYASDELKEYMNSDGGMGLESLKIDGKLYGLPRLGDPTGAYPMMFIRKDWLDNLGLEMPETMDDLKEIAHAFTYDDPDGNGENDTYGLALDGVNIINNTIGDTDPIFFAFDAYLGDDGMAFIEKEDGTIAWGGENTEGVKAGLQFLQDLYSDGSLAKDFITMDSNTVFEEAGAGRCGIWFGPLWAGMVPASNAAKNDLNAHVVTAPVPDGVNQGGSKAYLSSAINSIYCVSSQCEDPVAFIKLWNLCVHTMCYETDPEKVAMYMGDASGKYSGWKASLIHCTAPNEGYTGYLLGKEALETGDTSKLSATQMSDYEIQKAYLDAVAAGNFDPEDSNQSLGIAMYTVVGDPLSAWATIEKMTQEDRFVYSAYNALPSETLADISPTLKKLLVENIVKIITGDDVNNFDSFMETWYALGGQDAIDEVNAWAQSNK